MRGVLRVVRGEFVREEEEAVMRRSDEAVRKDEVLDFPVARFVRGMERTIGAKRGNGAGVDSGSVSALGYGTAIERIRPGEPAKKSAEAKLGALGGGTSGFDTRPRRTCFEHGYREEQGEWAGDSCHEDEGYAA
jgi:hypothetical protein